MKKNTQYAVNRKTRYNPVYKLKKDKWLIKNMAGEEIKSFGIEHKPVEYSYTITLPIGYKSL